ncbi:MAG: hypothetical protein NTW19_10810, partial [Planctomycetota bacterium]|nr:hypothetical protein [Planctomycetota bacterium]
AAPSTTGEQRARWGMGMLRLALATNDADGAIVYGRQMMAQGASDPVARGKAVAIMLESAQRVLTAGQASPASQIVKAVREGLGTGAGTEWSDRLADLDKRIVAAMPPAPGPGPTPVPATATSTAAPAPAMPPAVATAEASALKPPKTPPTPPVPAPPAPTPAPAPAPAMATQPASAAPVAPPTPAATEPAASQPAPPAPAPPATAPASQPAA